MKGVKKIKKVSLEIATVKFFDNDLGTPPLVYGLLSASTKTRVCEKSNSRHATLPTQRSVDPSNVRNIQPSSNERVLCQSPWRRNSLRCKCVNHVNYVKAKDKRIAVAAEQYYAGRHPQITSAQLRVENFYSWIALWLFPLIF
jgi:hypothetical protein